MKNKFKISNRTKKQIIIIASIACILLISALCLFLILRQSNSAIVENESGKATSSVVTTAPVTYAPTTTAVTESQTSEQATTQAETTDAPETTTEETTTAQTTTAQTTEKSTEAPTPQPTSDVTYISGIMIVNKSYPLPQNYNPGGLLPEVKSAFNTMASDAQQQGLSLSILSGFRTYEYQSKLYEGYAAKSGYAAADRYSARPGYSEHQSGLAIDVNSLDNSFAYTAEGIWLAENCYKYGFILRYPEGKEAWTGYMYEPWHIRYLGVDTATAVFNSGLCLEEYLGINSQYKD